MSQYTIEKCTKEDNQLIEDGIIEYNAKQVPYTQNPAFMAVNRVLKDHEGTVLAGVNCIMYCWNILTIDLLWVKEGYRKMGYGTILLNEIEKIAKEQDCHLIHLDTFDFQAKDFYLKHGYELFGQLEDCPKDHIRYFFKKNL